MTSHDTAVHLYVDADRSGDKLLGERHAEVNVDFRQAQQYIANAGTSGDSNVKLGGDWGSWDWLASRLTRMAEVVRGTASRSFR